VRSFYVRLHQEADPTPLHSLTCVHEISQKCKTKLSDTIS